MKGFKLPWTNSYFRFCCLYLCFISAFALLAGALVSIASSVVGLKTCAWTAGIKNYNSKIMKKGKNYNNTGFIQLIIC